MSVTKRFTLLFGGLMLGLAAAFGLLHALEKKAQNRVFSQFLTEQKTVLNHWAQADARSHLEEIRGLAARRNEDQSIPPQNPSRHHAQSLWELTEDGILIEHWGGTLPLSEVNLFRSTEFLVQALNKEGGWFYFIAAQEFHRVSFARIKSTSGWIFLVQKWDRPFISKLGSLVDGTLSLEPEPVPDHFENGRYQISIELRDWRGLPLRFLTLTGILPEYRSQWSIAGAPTLLFIGFGVIVILAMALGLRQWVIKPLTDIKTCLITETTSPAERYLTRSDEIGHLARSVEDTSLQREALRQSEIKLQTALDERIRLGRDLHDGVIQSLYATGMALATVQSKISPENEPQRTTIGQCRDTLNECILDLRNFIIGLEPEALKQPSFTLAVSHLLSFAAAGNGMKTRCDIDEDLARELSIGQRAHILQITREALSNARRHGKATEVSTQLMENGSFVDFHFRDNGHGFSTDDAQSFQGHGLQNLANRARELGASFSVESRPGEGTHIKLRFKHTRLS